MTEPDHETADSDLAEAEASPRLIPQPHGGALLPPPRKGERRNPLGRQPDSERLLRKLLRQHPDALSRAADALSRVLVDETSKHWLGALREVWDRSEGPVVRELSHHVSTDRAVITHASPPHPPALPEDVDVDPTSAA